jgi:hypothetical protein
MPRSRVLDLIKLLDPERDHKQIVYLSTCYDFPFDTTRALEFALFRTFCSPSVSAILHSTGEFNLRAQKRYDDTDLILSEMLEYGYDSERGKAALRRMNKLHGRYNISNDDYLYVLSTFIYEPVRWNARFGWRPMCEVEKLATYYYWREVGRLMGIKSIPPSYGEFEQYNVEYERANFRYSETNRRVGEATRDMFLGWFLPAPLRRYGEPAICAMMDEPLLRAFGFPQPPRLLRRIVEGALRIRGRVAGHLPRRRRPRLRTEMRHRAYPNGYTIAELGPSEPAYSSPYFKGRDTSSPAGAREREMAVAE